MKMNDLKTGMRVTTKYSVHPYIVYRDAVTFFGSTDYLIAANGSAWSSGYFDKLDIGIEEKGIVKVETPKCPYDRDPEYIVLWETGEEEMTMEQVCKELGRNIKIVK